MTIEQHNQSWAALTSFQRQCAQNIYRTSHDGNVEWILETLFGKHNLTSDAEPEEMISISRKRVQELYSSYNEEYKTEENGSLNKFSLNARISMLEELFGFKCLPDELEHRLEQTSVQVEESKAEPKFKVGDNVRIIGGKAFIGEVAEIISVDKDDPDAPYKIGLLYTEGCGMWCSGSDLEPYTEPNQTNDNMDEKELNLKEILKGHEGEIFFSPIIGNCKLRNMANEYIYMAYLNNLSYCFHIDGRRENNGLCVLYPSREAYLKYPLDARAAWMEWQEERKSSVALEVGLDMVDLKRIITHHSVETIKFSSMEEAKQAAKAVVEFLKLYTQKNCQ